MTENTSIEWADHTFNPWWGCERVSPACDFCYAADTAKRWGKPELWEGERRRIKNWAPPRRWQNRAKTFFDEHGRRQRVFSASMADIFDNQVPAGWRADFWDLVRQCPDLDWLLLTKRPMNIKKMLPPFWDEIKGRVWMGTTAENQKAANLNIPHLLKIDAAVLFVSYEPALGPVDFTKILISKPDEDFTTLNVLTGHYTIRCELLDGTGTADILIADPVVTPLGWIIAGGESGPKARRPIPKWFFDVGDQCERAGVAFLFKQWGAWSADGKRLGKKKTGRSLGGKTYTEFPNPRGL